MASKGNACQNVSQQLEELCRELDEVPQDSNSFFESVARQVNDPSTAQESLRHIASANGLSSPERYFRDECGKNKRLLTEWRMEVEKLKKSYFWSLKFYYQHIAMLSDALKTKIVILRNMKPRLEFPSDGCPLDAKVIIVVESTFVHGYHSTKPKYNKAGEKQKMESFRHSFLNAEAEKSKTKHLVCGEKPMSVSEGVCPCDANKSFAGTYERDANYHKQSRKADEILTYSCLSKPTVAKKVFGDGFDSSRKSRCKSGTERSGNESLAKSLWNNGATDMTCQQRQSRSLTRPQAGNSCLPFTKRRAESAYVRTSFWGLPREDAPTTTYSTSLFGEEENREIFEEALYSARQSRPQTRNCSQKPEAYYTSAYDDFTGFHFY